MSSNMSRWTTSHPFPPHQLSKYGEIFTTRIGKNIWITIPQDNTGNREKDIERMHFIVFDSDTKQYKKVNCQFDGPIPDSVFSIESHGNHIYMLASADSSHLEEVGENNEDRYAGCMRLLRLDTKTLVWERFMRLSCGLKSLIFDDQIYFLQIALSSNITIVDLNTKQVTVHRFARPPEYSQYGAEWDIVRINGAVYIIAHNGSHRIVMIFRDGQLIQLKNDEYRDKDVTTYFNSNGSGTILYTQRTPTGTFYLDTFDPDTCEWKRQFIEKCCQCSYFNRVNSLWEIDGKMYSVMQSRLVHRSEYEIRVLDLKPDLSAICCNNIVDVLEKKKLKIAEKLTQNNLPNDIRIRVDNMNEWRADERVPIEKLYPHLS